jgi:mannose-1-phosphate guanylyltransferase
MPDLSAILAQLTVAWGSPEYDQRLRELWPTIQPQTIDYGIMERAEQTAVVPAQGIGWNDVGSWESLFEALPGDAHGNIILSTASHLELEDQNSLIYANTPDRLVVTIGLENMIVVDTPQALLVCPRHDAQKVRQVITLLKQNGMERYL